jgi:hypothetical protein
MIVSYLVRVFAFPIVQTLYSARSQHAYRLFHLLQLSLVISEDSPQMPKLTISMESSYLDNEVCIPDQCLVFHTSKAIFDVAYFTCQITFCTDSIRRTKHTFFVVTAPVI